MTTLTPSPARLPSYRRRYAQIAILVFVSLALVSLTAYRHVLHETTNAARLAAEREARINVVNDAFSQLYVVRQALHNFLLTPTQPRRADLNRGLQRLRNAMQRLAGRNTDRADSDYAEIAGLLDAETETLLEHISVLVAIRDDPARWFPATVLIEERLQPNNTLFMAHLGALIESLRQDDESARPVLDRLFDLQNAWLHMSDELRLVIANRFGAYSADPIAGMRAREHNVRVYADLVADLLLGLTDAEVDDDLLEIELESLALYAARWQHAFGVLIENLYAPDWRTDLSYLRAHVDPSLQAIQQRLGILRIELQSQGQQQVGVLSEISLWLSSLIFALLAGVLIIGVIGHLSLDRLILRPILELSRNLKSHAGHAKSSFSKPPAVSETNDLLEAFEHMHQQVIARERELNHLAQHDSLTGLPNRSLFRRQLRRAISDAQKHGGLVGLLFLDLDRFKQINDSYGHAAGDQMLVEIGRRLTQVFRENDLVARLGGDEFAVLLEHLNARDEMVRLADKALQAIKQPYAFDEHLFYSGASIGIAVSPDDGSDPDRLIQLADTAMYATKQDEGSSYRFVSDDMPADAAARHTLENELRRAVDSEQLTLHYQPVINTADGTLHCYEALLRWPHAEQGLLRPSSFMAAMADAGLCRSMSDWALDKIVATRPSADAAISINLGARLLQDKHFVQRLRDRLDRLDIAPEHLIIEISEDTPEDELDSLREVLHDLKARGVRVALDDFGTGQTSLGHLRRFPFDYVKIDQSFVNGIGKDGNEEELIRAMIRMTHALNMQVVAEGVETATQRAFLAANECDYIQGYLVGRPTASGHQAAH
jgi:diguanylate cyclase (GGDEF)-like protein